MYVEIKIAKQIYKIVKQMSTIFSSVCCNQPFSAREDGNFLKNISKKVIDDFLDCDLDSLLNIHNHYALLCYKCTMIQMGLNIETKEVCVELYYESSNRKYYNLI